MTLEKIQGLRQALLDNASGHPLARVHRNDLFTLLDEAEVIAKQPVEFAEPTDEPAPSRKRTKKTA